MKLVGPLGSETEGIADQYLSVLKLRELIFQTCLPVMFVRKFRALPF